MESTKAGMLNYIKTNLPSINILPVMIIKSRSFETDEQKTVEEVIGFAGNNQLAIRSSSAREDTSEYSNAGKFESFLNVPPEYNAIKDAIKQVYQSYHTEEDEEILIQPMLKGIKKSGVVFTSDIDTFADYYIVNFYEGDNSTAVTAGNSNSLKTYVQYKYVERRSKDQDMDNLITVCHQIEEFLNNDALDIEFAIDNEGNVFIFQVRPIARGCKETYQKVDLKPVLNRIYKKVKKLSVQHPFLLGHKTCFGVMPDWNPAEILGVRPKKLAISLYKELVTDNVWAHQRSDYGYRDLTMHPLMISFCGVPYIDTRITFNSFIPKDLNDKISGKLVDYYLNKLSRYPRYHDKIEFEIVFSCYYLGLHDKLKELLAYGFNENEITRIEFSLLKLTNNIIAPDRGLYKNDITKISILEKIMIRLYFLIFRS